MFAVEIKQQFKVLVKFLTLERTAEKQQVFLFRLLEPLTQLLIGKSFVSIEGNLLDLYLQSIFYPDVKTCQPFT